MYKYILATFFLCVACGEAKQTQKEQVCTQTLVMVDKGAERISRSYTTGQGFGQLFSVTKAIQLKRIMFKGSVYGNPSIKVTFLIAASGVNQVDQSTKKYEFTVQVSGVESGEVWIDLPTPLDLVPMVGSHYVVTFLLGSGTANVSDGPLPTYQQFSTGHTRLENTNFGWDSFYYDRSITLGLEGPVDCSS